MPAKPKPAKTQPIPTIRKGVRGKQKQALEEKLEDMQAKREAAMAKITELEERRGKIPREPRGPGRHVEATGAGHFKPSLKK
jgi:hypothetical protein